MPCSRRIHLPLVLALASLPGGAGAAPASTRGGPIVVTSCGDDGSVGTLRWALAQASEGDVIDASTLNCGTILLTGGALDISAAGPHPLAAVTIHGPGRAQLTIDGGDASRVIAHGIAPTDTGALRIEGLTITRGASSDGFAACIRSLGNLELDDVVVSDCHSEFDNALGKGGAIGVEGSLQLVSSDVLDSSTVSTFFHKAVGGGAYVGGDAYVSLSRIAGNTVEGHDAAPFGFDTGGGGLYVEGDLHIADSTIENNTVVDVDGLGYSGGVTGRRDVLIERSLVRGNTAPRGCALGKTDSPSDEDPSARSLVVVDSTITQNHQPRGCGVGGLYTVDIRNSTIAFNTFDVSGSGVYFMGFPDGLKIHSCIIAGNTVGGVATPSSDVDSGHMPGIPDGVRTIVGSHNLIEHASENVIVPADTLQLDPLLDALADNGGPTLTFALLPGSPAHDAGDNVFGLATDQRGFARVSGQATDIGAFETDEGDGIFADGFD